MTKSDNITELKLEPDPLQDDPMSADNDFDGPVKKLDVLLINLNISKKIHDLFNEKTQFSKIKVGRNWLLFCSFAKFL